MENLLQTSKKETYETDIKQLFLGTEIHKVTFKH